MLTIAHADRGKSTLKDDERPFRYGFFPRFQNECQYECQKYASILFYERQTYNAKHNICVSKVDYNVISTLLLYIICKNIIQKQHRNLRILRTFS